MRTSARALATMLHARIRVRAAFVFDAGGTRCLPRRSVGWSNASQVRETRTAEVMVSIQVGLTPAAAPTILSLTDHPCKPQQILAHAHTSWPT
jgi:hypothetical protein